MSTETRRLKMMQHFQQKDGCSPSVASRAAVAFLPLDNAVHPDRSFEKAVRKLSWQFTRASKRAPAEEIDRLATETLTALRGLAVAHGESYYSQLYGKALSADFAPSNLVVGGGATKKVMRADPNRSARYNRALARSQTPRGLMLQLSGRMVVLGGVGFGLWKLFG